MELIGKRALVTGGAVRLGRAICEVLAARGCEVIIHYNRSEAEAVDLVSLLKGQGRAAFCVQGNLNGEPACEHLMQKAVDVSGGGVDILVNNASVFHKHGFLESGSELLIPELEINTFAPMYLTRAFARQSHLGSLTAGLPVGKVIQLLDRRVAGQEKGMLAYLVSKKALYAYTRIAALELGPSITVNAVAPGPVLPPPGRDASYLHDHAGATVLDCRPSTSDVAAAVLYLLEADAVTGQTLFVDSGQHLL